MGIISAYIVNKAGGLIFSHDQPSASAEVEATFSYPLGIVLEEVDRYLVVKFAENMGFKVSWNQNTPRSYIPLHACSWLLPDCYHGQTLNKKCLPDGRTAMMCLPPPPAIPLPSSSLVLGPPSTNASCCSACSTRKSQLPKKLAHTIVFSVSSGFMPFL